MQSLYSKTLRKYGYDILINNFEITLRDFLLKRLFAQYGKDWQNYVPLGVFVQLRQQGLSPENLAIDAFFDELAFLNLKDIIASSSNYSLSKSFLGELSKEKFIELFDELNIYRRKVAHAKSTFSAVDLKNLIDVVKILCQGQAGKEVIKFIENEAYLNAKEIPADFYEEYVIVNNLPIESYDLDGGFVGREKEIRTIKAYIKSEQDRVITITGSGGVGKTAIALKVAYSFLSEPQPIFNAIVWFSAKNSKLTEKGIISIEPEIQTYEKLILDILEVIDPKTLRKFKKARSSPEQHGNYLNSILSSKKHLIIIDNLERR
jgi:hypothetical protein